jgi:hypothetical protein
MTNPMRLARGSDPESSKLAAEEIIDSGGHTAQKQFVLRALSMHDGATARELAKYMATLVERDINALVHVIGRRLPDLEKDRRVRRGPQRTCVVGKRQALTWWITKEQEP